jgi:precorrin-6B methylase 2
MQLAMSGYDLFLSRFVYDEFRQRPGSDRIASAFSLCQLSRLIRLRKPKTVLEIGAGIGTISQLILLHSEAVENLYSIEHHPFCCASLRENLTPQRGQKWNLLNSQADLPKGIAFDLIIFDGNQYDDSTLNVLTAETAVFVDGMRCGTRVELTSHCEKMGLRLQLHELKGAWRVALRGFCKKRPVPSLVVKRERCHIGICKATSFFLAFGQSEYAALSHAG